MAEQEKIILAPMEGVMDAPLRRTITAVGGIDRCVTEFIRVVDAVLPDKVFYRYCPELKTGGCTDSGTPVRIQLLGSESLVMADNALKAVDLGADSIDINFGCPSKTVNGSRGGAYLLQYPDDIYHIVSRMRRLLPDDIVLSAKMRLGWDNMDDAVAIAQTIADAGADELTVHARTKAQEYRSPVHWQRIYDIQNAIDIPVIANGDITDKKSYDTCRTVTGCDQVMIGRGLLANPFCAKGIKADLKTEPLPKVEWTDVLALLLHYYESCVTMGYVTTGATYQDIKSSRYLANRLKQWIKYMFPVFPQAEPFFTPLRLLHSSDEILILIRQELDKNGWGNDLTK